jgi:uncharacterized membrane protein HdeD (DUF308 family)
VAPSTAPAARPATRRQSALFGLSLGLGVACSWLLLGHTLMGALLVGITVGLFFATFGWGLLAINRAYPRRRTRDAAEHRVRPGE